MDKNYSNDNYNLVYSDTMIITTTFAHSVAFDLLTELGSTYEDCGPEDSNGVCKLFSCVLFSCMEILRHATIKRQATTMFIPATTSKTNEETDVPVIDVKYIDWVKKRLVWVF